MSQKKTLRLSNTAVDTYTACPFKYKLHYVDKIRAKTIGSALIFGKAVDEALNVLLLTKKKELTEEEKTLVTKCPHDVFDLEFSIANINGDIVDTKNTYRVDYYRSDCDLSVLTQDDYSWIKITEDEAEELHEEIIATLRSKQKLSDEQQKMFNLLCWHSLYRKGHIFIDTYIKDVMPEIKEVHSIQNEVNLPNENGDYIIGYIDFVATFNDGIKRIVDNKTAGQAYKKDAVENSQQLAIYSEYMENRECSYIVLVKKLRKKEPRVRTQIIHGIIPEDLLEKVFDKIGETEYNIKRRNFKQNRDSCFMWGKKCAYYDYCRQNKSMKNLVDIKK